jgi:hypothetical protein
MRRTLWGHAQTIHAGLIVNDQLGNIAKAPPSRVARLKMGNRLAFWHRPGFHGNNKKRKQWAAQRMKAGREFVIQSPQSDSQPLRFAIHPSRKKSSRVFSLTLGKVTLLVLTMCYVITLMLPPTTIISRATAITVRSPASSPGGVLDCTKAKYCCYRPGARTLKDKGWSPKKYGGNNCSRRGPMS